MRRFVVGLAILAVLTSSATLLHADDQQIAQQLVQQLKQQKDSGNLRGFGIDLKVDQGSVWLKGRVSDSQQQQLVLDLARRIPGVKQVINDLSITGKSTTTTSVPAATQAKPLSDKTKSILSELGSSVKKAFGPREKTAEKKNPQIELVKMSRSSRRTSRSTLRPLRPAPVAAAPVETKQDNSAQVAQQILNELRQHKASGALKNFGLDLKVDNGVVKLTGRVADQAQQELVLETVRRVQGVKLVVNRIAVQPAAPAVIDLPSSPINNTALGSGLAAQPAVAATPVAAPAVAPTPVPAPVVAQTPAPAPVVAGTQVAPRVAARPVPVQAVPSHLQPTPVASQINPYRPRGGQTPLAFAPAGAARYRGPVSQGVPASPRMAQMPPYIPAGNATPARYDHPQMPGYAWPSYAPHPNYGGVTYPKQYSPTAWPYIGPFYPYPQVPLGWRKVSLEWKDGWWMLDFKERN